MTTRGGAFRADETADRAASVPAGDAPERPAASDGDGDAGTTRKPKAKRRRRWGRRTVWLLLFVAVLLLIGRILLPTILQRYVNRTLDQSPLYEGEIGDVDVYLWRGAYTIEDVRINKVTGNVPHPLFAAKRVDLAVQWDTLLKGKVVGRILMVEPQLNFVDAADESADQSGVRGGPWLEIIQDLFPFRINSAVVRNGSITFRAIDSEPPVTLSLDELDASVENLTNINDEVTPLVTTVTAKGLAMGHAKLEYQMKLDPFSYRPTFQMALRLIGLDVTKMNDLTRAYGRFDFERGWFDLVVEVDAKEGAMDGYVKPLFRQLKVLSLDADVQEDNVLGVFWEALVGGATEILENQPRDQFGTVIPLRGDLTGPQTDVLTVVGNVLRNAFVRAYLPRLHGDTPALEGMRFDPGSVSDPVPASGG